MSLLALTLLALTTFPQETAAPAAKPEPTSGYTLITPLLSTKVHLLDLEGNPVHTWNCDEPPGNSVYLMPDGNLLRAARPKTNTVFRGGGEGGRIQKIAWDGEVLWDYLLSDDTVLHHHDFEPLPNGNLLLIAWEARTRDEAIAAGRHAENVGPAGVWPDHLLEIRPVGKNGAEIVWEWHVWDHLIQDLNPHLPNYGKPSEHPGRVDVNFASHKIETEETAGDKNRRKQEEAHLKGIGYMGGDDDHAPDEPKAEPAKRDVRGADWMHTNGIDYDAEHDLIVISVRRFDEVWLIDHSTTTEEARGSTGGRQGRGGDLVWRWGNPEASGRGESNDQRLYKQHDPTFVRTEGRFGVLVFNNGNGRPKGNRSSADEIAIPMTDAGLVAALGPDEAMVPTDVTWSHMMKRRMYSHFISGAQRLPNGNTLICSGENGRLVEVTMDGQIAWYYQNTHGGDRKYDGPKPAKDAQPDPDSPPKDGAPKTDPPKTGGGGPKPISLFRATRIPFDHPGLAGKNLPKMAGAEGK
tara:strand:- start:30250 stop:31815 length:1566 start_codon:yes stop_codon:yes gene_type:complete